MGDYVAIDECLYSMRNKISIKQFNPNKPAKYGLLFKELNEVRIPYIHRSEIYAGRPQIVEDNPASEYYNPTVEGVTLRLVDQVAKYQDVQGRNITMDNLYTSMSLFEKLLDRKVTAVGTMRSNRRGIPNEVKSTFQREDKTTLVFWESKKNIFSLTSYVVKTKSKGLKNILVLSTMPIILGNTIDDEKKKPAIIKFYDFTKGGTDIVDQRIDKYTVSGKTNSWPKKVFWFMLDSTRINAQTINSLNHSLDVRKRDSFEFTWALIMSLVTPQLRARRKDGLTLNTLKKIELLLPKDEREEVNPNQSNLLDKTGQRRRCRVCMKECTGKDHKKKKDKLGKMATQCQRCGEACCAKHTIAVCKDCHTK